MEQNLKEILRKSKKLNPEDFFIKVHYLFCVKFGWVPLEEFKKLPTPMVMDFMGLIAEDKQSEKSAIEKAKKKAKQRR